MFKLFGKTTDKTTTKKAPWTMVMQVANAHAFSIGFIGIQLTHGYVAALALSSASVIVGMILTLHTRLIGTGQAAWSMAVIFGLLLGGIMAFVYDSMTLFGLKMVHESKGWKKWFAFVLIGLGIGLSTQAGDQMWQQVYADWHSWVGAMSVSCVIIMMDVWHKEHQAAVKRSSQQPDTMQTALNTEVEVVVDKKLRQYTHEQLNSPEMEQHLRTQSLQSVQQIVQAKFNKRLELFAGESAGSVGSVGRITHIEEVPQPKQLGSGKRTRKRNLYTEHREAFVEYMQAHPHATLVEIASQFALSESGAGLWRSRYLKERDATKTLQEDLEDQAI